VPVEVVVSAVVRMTIVPPVPLPPPTPEAPPEPLAEEFGASALPHANASVAVKRSKPEKERRIV
jgi:hypothetical protein